MNSNADEPEQVIRYLSASDLYNLNDEVTEGHTFVRDAHLLNSAAKRPAIVVFGEPQFPTIPLKAAALLHSMAYHHLFADGNKRTALKAVTLFLQVNGYRLKWDSRSEYEFILEIAQGKMDVEQIAERLTPSIEARPDAAT